MIPTGRQGRQTLGLLSPCSTCQACLCPPRKVPSIQMHQKVSGNDLSTKTFNPTPCLLHAQDMSLPLSLETAAGSRGPCGSHPHERGHAGCTSESSDSCKPCPYHYTAFKTEWPYKPLAGHCSQFRVSPKPSQMFSAGLVGCVIF